MRFTVEPIVFDDLEELVLGQQAQEPWNIYGSSGIPGTPGSPGIPGTSGTSGTPGSSGAPPTPGEGTHSLPPGGVSGGGAFLFISWGAQPKWSGPI